MSRIDVILQQPEEACGYRPIATIGRLEQEENLIYTYEKPSLAAHLRSTKKFALLTLTSPLIGIARLVRAVAFATYGDNMNRAGREFIGAFAYPIMTTACLGGVLLSATITLMSSESTSFYMSMQRAYAYFEAWVNDVDLQGFQVASFSQRASNPYDAIGNGEKWVWTTAPCMQPVLERGFSNRGGILDPHRIQRLFPHVNVERVERTEDGEIAVIGDFIDRSVSYEIGNGACEHGRQARTCCCCFRVERTYDRVLCFEFHSGTCTSFSNPDPLCGISGCSMCGLEVCCCSIDPRNTVNFIDLFSPGVAGIECQHASNHRT